MDGLPSVQQKPFDYFGFQLVLLYQCACNQPDVCVKIDFCIRSTCNALFAVFVAVLGLPSELVDVLF